MCTVLANKVMCKGWLNMIKQGLEREGRFAKTVKLKIHKFPQCDTDIK